MCLIKLLVTKKTLMTVFVLCYLCVCYQTVAAPIKTGINKTNVQESKQMTKKSLGMPAGKRVGPEDVTPVTANGVRYEVLHWGRDRGLEQNGGYIVAVDSTSSKELWLVRIYEINYKPKLETDVQDVFIQSIELSDDNKLLKVIDENGRQFTLDLITKKVTAH
jgi:hypothetical protein